MRATISTSRGDVFPSLWWGRLPIITVSITVIENMSPLTTGTKAIALASSRAGISRRSMPSIRILPAVGLLMPSMHLTRVDFPTPLGPMMQYRPGSVMERSM